MDNIIQFVCHPPGIHVRDTKCLITILTKNGITINSPLLTVLIISTLMICFQDWSLYENKHTHPPPLSNLHTVLCFCSDIDFFQQIYQLLK